MASYGVNVRLRGATVQGRGPARVRAMTLVALDEIADYAKFEVLSQLDSVLQNPTGYYESQIRKDRVSVESYSVNDSNVIYGPWLEGIGSRNSPVTRFAGYHTFRIVRNRMAQKAADIADAAIRRAGL